MSVPINTTSTGYQHLYHKWADHRTDDWLLMGSPWPLVAIVAAYVYFGKNGPKYMKGRASYYMDIVLYMYYMVQIAACVYLAVQGLEPFWTGKYRLICEPVDYSDSQEAIKMAHIAWLYLLHKIFDLLDTVLFVVRKKEHQVTPFHLFHHVAMLVIAWLTAKFVPGGHITMLGVLVTLTRLNLYCFNLITRLCPNENVRRFWKARTTEFLVMVATLGAVHSLSIVFVRDCGFPPIVLYSTCAGCIFFATYFFLFNNQPTARKKIL